MKEYTKTEIVVEELSVADIITTSDNNHIKN